MKINNFKNPIMNSYTILSSSYAIYLFCISHLGSFLHISISNFCQFFPDLGDNSEGVQISSGHSNCGIQLTSDKHIRGGTAPHVPPGISKVLAAVQAGTSLYLCLQM